MGESMYYMVKKVKKKKFLQKSYVIKENVILLTDTKRAKKRFLKEKPANAVVTEDFAEDLFFKDKLTRMYGYDVNILINYLEPLIHNMTDFLKMSLPLNEIVLCSKTGVRSACKYAKMVTVIGEGNDETIDGVSIRYVKKLKTIPDLVIITDNKTTVNLFGVPCIDLRENPSSGRFVSNMSTMSFRCSVLPFDISAEALMWLLKRADDIAYTLSSCRKKSPVLFTFS